MVQTKAVRERSKDTVQESKETENAQETDAEQRVGSTVRRHGAFEIRTFDSSHVLDGGKMRWIVEDPNGCDDTLIAKFIQECKPSNMAVDYEGHPEKEGMCIVILEGTEAEIEEFLDKCRDDLSGDTKVEADAEMHLIPEMPPDTEDSLLETDARTPLWGLDRIDDRQNTRDSDYTPPNTGKNVHVFVADTGIRTTHTDFGGRAIPTIDATISNGNPRECSFTDTNCAKDNHGHGTHCAGTIGGDKYGVAKDAKLHAVKVLSDRGGGSFSWFIKSLDWVEQAGHLRPAVFSASLGGYGRLDTVRQAIDDVTKKGVLVVVAAGNDGRTSRPNACSYTPAFVPSAVTVGSTTISDSRSSWSNYGSCLDIFAPGSDIKSAGHSSNTAERTMSGTSMACPHVAGAAALIFEKSSSKSAKAVGEELSTAATPNVVRDSKSSSPNLLLFVGTTGATPTPKPTPPRPNPTPTPKPTPPKPKPTPAPAPPGTCIDKAKNCAKLKKKGKCKKLGVKRRCQKTCEACCMDFHKKCAKMKGKCSQAAVKEKCPLTCKVCSNSGSS